jgi:hypothetical protein
MPFNFTPVREKRCFRWRAQEVGMLSATNNTYKSTDR